MLAVEIFSHTLYITEHTYVHLLFLAAVSFVLAKEKDSLRCNVICAVPIYLSFRTFSAMWNLTCHNCARIEQRRTAAGRCNV